MKHNLLLAVLIVGTGTSFGAPEASSGMALCKKTASSVSTISNRKGVMIRALVLGSLAAVVAKPLYPETCQDSVLGIALLGGAIAAADFLWTNTRSSTTTLPSDSHQPLNVRSGRSQQVQGQQSVSSFRVDTSETRGYRRSMEDTHIVCNEPYPLFGVFDGHGGSEVSDHACKNFSSLFNHNLSRLSQQFMGQKELVRKSLIASLEQLEEQVLWVSAFAEAGSTAVVAVLDENGDKRMLDIANVGDSRALLIRQGKVVLATRDHKPNDSEERKRISDAGGEVCHNGVWRVNGLAVSRAIGDKDLKDYGAVIATPDIYSSEIEKGDRLIMASDGLWDKVSNDEAAKLGDLSAKELEDKALKRGSKDNITVIVVDFS